MESVLPAWKLATDAQEQIGLQGSLRNAGLSKVLWQSFDLHSKLHCCRSSPLSLLQVLLTQP
eukprot:CCRYP_002390-RD/>CCRYP_002390-RD protein AED:0.49 eAED:1.00 QI:0/0/0/1/0/0/2/0/61